MKNEILDRHYEHLGRMFRLWVIDTDFGKFIPQDRDKQFDLSFRMEMIKNELDVIDKLENNKFGIGYEN